VVGKCGRLRGFQAALAAAPGSDERGRFIFRDGRGPGGEQPPNNWPSQFGGSAWTRVTEAGGSGFRPGQWYLQLFDTSQPDWSWHHPDVPALFEDVIRFWLDRGVAGLRVDVAHGIFKDPDLPDITGTHPPNAPSPYRHRPELQALYRSWRARPQRDPARQRSRHRYHPATRHRRLAGRVI
jgi:alpha-glucosidase